MKTFIKAVAISALAFLAACSSTPEASTDGIEEMASLAGSDGNLDATLEVVSVGSSSGLSASSLNFEEIKFSYKGKRIKGFITPESGQDLFRSAGVSAAVAQGDRVRVRGRVSRIKGVPTFVGLMRPDTTQASAAAATQVPVVMVGGNKTIPPTMMNKIELIDVIAQVACSTLRDMEILILRTSDGKPFASGMFKSTTGTKFDPIDGNCSVTLNLQGNVVQTPAGPVGQVTGQIKIEGRQPVAIIAILIGL